MHEVAAHLINQSLESYEQCISEDIEKRLLSAWKDYDSLVGKKISVLAGRQKISGKAMGIDQTGGLRVKLRNGKFKIVHAGEVIVS